MRDLLNFADVNFRISFAFKLLAEKYYSKGAGHQRDVLSNCLSYFWSITKYNPLWLLTLKWVWVVPWLWHMNMDLTFIFVHAYLLDSQRAHQTALVCVSCAVLCSGVCVTLEITKCMYSDSYSIKVLMQTFNRNQPECRIFAEQLRVASVEEVKKTNLNNLSTEKWATWINWVAQMQTQINLTI